MRAFDVYLNNRKLCTAGISEAGVVTTILTWLAPQSGDPSESMDLHVGGLLSRTQTDIHWARRTIRSGDKIRIEVGECHQASQSKVIRTETGAARRKRKLEHLKVLAEELGYEIKRKRRAQK